MGIQLPLGSGQPYIVLLQWFSMYQLGFMKNKFLSKKSLW